MDNKTLISQNFLNYRLRFLPLIYLVFISSVSIYAQEAWTNKSRILPDKLRLIPTTLTLQHSPNHKFPELLEEPDNEARYVWKSSTTVCSPSQDLEIVEAGSFIWFSPDGWKQNMMLSKEDFINHFNCPNGILKTGVCYSFEKNYRYGNQLYGGDALWFVIAKNKEGLLYKGFGIIETEGELKNG